MANPPYFVDELRACLISREFEDGERIFLGANVNIGRAAVLIAHRLRGPNMKIMLGLSWTNLSDHKNMGLHPDSTDFRDARWAESWRRSRASGVASIAPTTAPAASVCPSSTWKASIRPLASAPTTTSTASTLP